MYTQEVKEVFDLYKRAAEEAVNMPINWLTLHHTTYADMRVIMANHLMKAGHKRKDIAQYMQLDKSNICRFVPKYEFRIKNDKRFAMLDESFSKKLSQLQNN